VPEGDKGDDLFEDLDKFFAPIQDVDWPETAAPEGAAGTTGPAAEPEGPGGLEPGEPTRSEDTAAMEQPVSFEAGEPVGEPFTEPSPPEASEIEEPEEWAPQVEPAATREAVGRDGEDEAIEAGEEAGEVSLEGLIGGPADYVDLPGGPEEEAGAEAELDEGPETGFEETPAARAEEPPSPEEVEAAARHFAESLGEEPSPEPEPQPETAAFWSEEQGSGAVEEEILAGLGESDQQGRTVKVGAEGLGGPSWQEPTAMEVGLDHERRLSGRNVPTAFVTGLVLAALAVGSIAIGKGPFAIVAAVITLWAQGEFYLALQKRHQQPATALGLVSGALILAAAYFRGEAAMLALFALSMFATFLWYMAVPVSHRKGTASNIGVTILGVAYVPLLAGYVLAILTASDGRGITLAVIGLTFVYDTAAFVIGSWWGSRPLAPTISPKKSIEGAVGATLVVIAVSVGGVAPYVHVLDTVGRSVGLAVVVAIFAPLGDLAESLLKRDLGLKDMGSVLPGHGGVLDRIDSVLFVAPAALLFLKLILS